MKITGFTGSQSDQGINTTNFYLAFMSIFVFLSTNYSPTNK